MLMAGVCDLDHDELFLDLSIDFSDGLEFINPADQLCESLRSLDHEQTLIRKFQMMV